MILATPNAELRDKFGQAKDQLVQSGLSGSKSIRNLTYVNGISFVPEIAPTQPEMERFLIRETADFDICILLLDIEWMHLATAVLTAALVIRLNQNDLSQNFNNSMRRVVARALRNAAYTAGLFSISEDRQALSLPLRNFYAQELSEIEDLYKNKADAADLANNLDKYLSKLRRRKRPPRRSTYSTRYLVDDKRRFFVYGHEDHSRFATSAPHLPHCQFRGTFRFGCRISQEHHFNVSETEGDKTSIEGQFFNCHRLVPETVQKTSHLNMFANDYF